jgi:hypothetical protein
LKANPPHVLDASAIGLSVLCVAHCLALPILAASSPAFSDWAGSEWVHAVVILVAAPLSALALWHPGQSRLVIGLGIVGVLLLGLGLAHWPAGIGETALTVAGSLALGLAHLRNWIGKHGGPHTHA